MSELEFVVTAPAPSRTVAFPGKSFFIGSDLSCQLCFASALLSARHAEVVKDTRGEWWVRDLTGAGSVAVNGKPVIDERLSAGDTLRVGDVVLEVRNTGVSADGRTRDNMPVISLPNSLLSVELAPNVVIDQRYRVVKKLAQGGMGEVYRAEHVELGKPLAIKVMLPELSRDQELVNRFKREAIAASRIGHQNIVDISDFGRTPDDRFYYVMEFVDGRSLASVLREGALPIERAVRIALQTARALNAAHAANIIHRDLKPDNVMVSQRATQTDFVKVLDFGLARTAGPGLTSGVGALIGTPQYLAPEQVTTGAIEMRSDVYSLGLMLHEMISGAPVFSAPTAVELVRLQVEGKPRALLSPLGAVPKPLEELVTQMLMKDPAQRPHTMESVIGVLDSLSVHSTPAYKTIPGAGGLAPVTIGHHEAKTRRADPQGWPTMQVKGVGLELDQRPLSPPPRSKGAPSGSGVNLAHGEQVAAQQLAGQQLAAQQLAAQQSRAPTPAPVRPAPASAPTLPELSITEQAVVPRGRTPLIVGGLSVLVLTLAGALWATRREPAPQPLPPTVPSPTATATPPGPTPPEPKPSEAKPPDLKPPDLKSPDPKSPEQPPPEPVVLVKVTLESTPDHAEVLEDDVLLGATPLALSRPQGSLAELRFEAKGFKPLSRKLRFEAESTLKFELERQPSDRAQPPRPPRPSPGTDGLKDVPF